MKILTEGRISIELPPRALGWKFDNPIDHGLTHCMKSVDFIIEFKGEIYFLEIKDPSAAPLEIQKDRKKFLQQFCRGELDRDLSYKYRDSYLYLKGLNKIRKAAVYIVLIIDDNLDQTSLLIRTDELRRQLPIQGPFDKPWPQPFIKDCIVFNSKIWNKRIPQFKLSIN
jgi:hypothetical protein